MKRFNRKKLIPSLAASVMVAAATLAPLPSFLVAGNVYAATKSPIGTVAKVTPTVPSSTATKTADQLPTSTVPTVTPAVPSSAATKTTDQLPAAKDTTSNVPSTTADKVLDKGSPSPTPTPTTNASKTVKNS
jgi:hypothetical protein